METMLCKMSTGLWTLGSPDLESVGSVVAAQPDYPLERKAAPSQRLSSASPTAFPDPNCTKPLQAAPHPG